MEYISSEDLKDLETYKDAQDLVNSVHNDENKEFESEYTQQVAEAIAEYGEDNPNDKIEWNGDEQIYVGLDNLTTDYHVGSVETGLSSSFEYALNPDDWFERENWQNDDRYSYVDEEDIKDSVVNDLENLNVKVNDAVEERLDEFIDN